MSLTTDNKNRALNLLLPAGCEASLHCCDGKELDGNGYKRQRVHYGETKDGVKENDAAVTFSHLPEAAGIDRLAIWHPDGSHIWTLPFKAEQSVKEGGVITFPAGHIQHVLK